MNLKSKNNLPEGLLVAWYGDDFTGSAAVMEVLSFAGLPSVLFLDVPTPDQLAAFQDIRSIGIAGTARSHSPDWMAKNLPPIFNYLKSLDAPITHYKVCSTFDSSPRVGSIGQAIDLAQPIFESKWIPLLLAAPAIRRYQSFGHLFAAAPGGVFRLDRHPVMTRHPVTPMTESDVARHLAKQTDRPIGLIDLEMLIDKKPVQLRDETGKIFAIDSMTESDLTRAGQLIWENRDTHLFAVGSQGVEYALVNYWHETGQLVPKKEPEGISTSDNMVVVSGSVSPVTQEQIEWSLQNGFSAVQFDATAVLADKTVCNNAVSQTVNMAIAALDSGKDPIIYTACGPDDPAVQNFRKTIADAGISADVANNRVGTTLGIILDKVLLHSGIRRAVISGGDTSGHATQQLGIYALTALAPTIPGAALFQAHSKKTEYHNLQLALKGGQMGTIDYFGWIKQGGGTAWKRRTTR